MATIDDGTVVKASSETPMRSQSSPPQKVEPRASRSTRQPQAEAVAQSELQPRMARRPAVQRLAQMQATVDDSPRVRGLVQLKRVVQRYFTGPPPQVIALVEEYVEDVHPDQLGAFRTIAFSDDPVSIYDWLADTLGVHLNDVYEWDNARGEIEEPVEIDYGFGQPEPPPPVAEPQWLAGQVVFNEEAQVPVVVTQEGAVYWLPFDAQVQLGQWIWFTLSEDQAYTAANIQVVPDAVGEQQVEDEEPGQTVPVPAIDPVTAQQTLTDNGNLTRGQFRQLIEGYATFDGATARNLLDSWNTVHAAEPISLEDVGWNVEGYQAAGQQALHQEVQANQPQAVQPAVLQYGAPHGIANGYLQIDATRTVDGVVVGRARYNSVATQIPGSQQTGVELSEVFVDPAYRRNGYSTMILNHALGVIGFQQRVWLDAQAQAQHGQGLDQGQLVNWYGRHGFQATGNGNIMTSIDFM